MERRKFKADFWVNRIMFYYKLCTPYWTPFLTLGNIWKGKGNLFANVS